MRLARRVAVLVSESEIVPCVVGAVWPAILLPASLLTGVPAEHLRALLAHELAHIRRHDYLVNLAQMLVEALLFFNPFVWWISRQIRIEREAGCDALAAAATGEGNAYARALVDYAELRLNPVLAQAPAFGEPARPSGLLDRIRRLAQPGYRPALRLPWPTLVLFLIISALALACMKKASDGAVVRVGTAFFAAAKCSEGMVSTPRVTISGNLHARLTYRG
jgi:beta-lactamase regulating signal transducer with metallopeptidase domain